MVTFSDGQSAGHGEKPSIQDTLGNRRLQLSATAKEADLLPHSYGSTILWTYANEPSSTLLIFSIFPQRFHSRAKDVDAVVLLDFGPRHVVEDAVERPDIGDIVDEHGQQVFALVIWSGVPNRPEILKWERTELGDDQPVEG